MTRAPSKRRAQIAAELTVPLPPVSQTLDMLETLATHSYETKTRTRAALKLAHRALRDLLQEIEADARYSELMSRAVAEALHRRLRRSLEFDKPRRFPSLPQVRTAAAATAPAVTATATPAAQVARPAAEWGGGPGDDPIALGELPTTGAFEREPGQRDTENHARAQETFWRPTTRPSMPAKGAKLALIRKHIDLLQRIDAGEQPTLDPDTQRVLRFNLLIIPRDLRDLTPQRLQESTGPFRLTLGVRDDIIAIRRAQARRRQRDATHVDRQRQLGLPIPLDTQRCARSPGRAGSATMHSAAANQVGEGGSAVTT